MYISLNWINELINLKNIKLEDLINTLTLGGFEVEDILKINILTNEDIILDISSTPNRADSLSIKGISQELKSLLNENIKINKYRRDSNLIQQNSIKNSLKLNNCSNFIALTVENLTNHTVPQWIKNKLIASQIQPLNNLLDFQTYLLLETGYPFEFYDLKKIREIIKNDDFNLLIKPAINNSLFFASNKINYKLSSEILLVQANEYPLSIAGIIVNNDFSYNIDSTSLLIELSIYNAKKIRQQSRILGLRTDRSAKYEKSLNSTDFLESKIGRAHV